VIAATISALGVSPHRSPLIGRRVKGRCVKPKATNTGKKSCRLPINLNVDYRLDAPANVTFSLMRRAPGRKVNGRCVGLTKKNRKHARCTRLLIVPGSIVQSATSGPNRFTFTGAIGGHTLGLGSYLLIAAPVGGRSTQTSFTIGG
jgi:hypothetical protein